MGIRSDQPPSRERAGRAAVALAACVITLLTVGAGSALASYTATVQNKVLRVTGDGAGDKLAVEVSPSDPSMVEVDVGDNGTADFQFPLASFTTINVEAGAGNDQVRFDGSASLAGKAVRVNGGQGNDRLFGSAGNDRLFGGPGNDFIVPERGSDVVSLGTGSDTVAWNPGDGSDTIDGSGGGTLDFNGANVSEKYDISANGTRARLSRDVGNVTMDLSGISHLNLTTLGGADQVTVQDLTGTGLRVVNVGLAALGGGGDGAADTVTAIGTGQPDSVRVTPLPDRVVVSGLYAQLSVSGAEPSTDAVDVDGLGGNDKLASGVSVTGPELIGFDGGDGTDTASYLGSAVADTIGTSGAGAAVDTSAPGASTLQTSNVENLSVLGNDGDDTITGGNGIAGLTKLTINGGNGDDQLTGGDGDDLIVGGDGDDTIIGGRGSDTALMGNGDDTFVWNPGDGSDPSIQGQSGSDTFLFSGANVAENVDFSANGGDVRFTRDVGNVVLDLSGIETAKAEMRGGADHVTVNDLSATSLLDLVVDLAGVPGSPTGDGQADTVTLNGTSGPDHVTATTLGSDVLVSGLHPGVIIGGSEANEDTLAIDTLGATDSVTVDPSVATLIKPVVDLGPQ